jgi:phosphoribosylformylglycinamidine cyclo-ligase
MYRVFNMGHRLEIYTDAESASRMIEIARSFHIDAQIVGRVEESSKKMLTIRSEHGEFIYES